MSVKIISKITLFFGILIFSLNGYAALNLELTRGIDSAIPIAIIPFQFTGSIKPSVDIVQVITQDLKNSGQFKILNKQSMQEFPHYLNQVHLNYWRGFDINNLVIGDVISMGNQQYKITYSLLDLYKMQKASQLAKGSRLLSGSFNPALVTKTYNTYNKNFRRVAHQIADTIYQKLTGIPGVFSTKIAYVVVKRPKNSETKYYLMVADADGYNPRAIVTSVQPIMSPAWSPDGKRIAYVSFENRRAAIYVSNVRTGSRELITRFPQINGAPAWSPDGQKLALVLSKEGNPKIYVMNLKSKKMSRETNGWSIDTEPSWSPDGKSIIFTSDRGGSPQIYQKNLSTGVVQRITYTGSYNARAFFTPDGKSIILLHRDQHKFNIAMQDLETNNMVVLTHSDNDHSPSISPNGKMIIYATYKELALVSVDGRVKVRLPESSGTVRDPVWGPFR